VRRVRAAGYHRLEAYTPFPVHGLAQALGYRETRLGWLAWLGGIAGAGLALLMQWGIHYDYPINVGGRPLAAWPAFAVVALQLGLLSAALSTVVGMLVMSDLPRLHQPLFEVERFHLDFIDWLFLFVDARDPQYDAQATRDFLRSLGASWVGEVPR
jgi:hypothetical protein